MRVAGDTLVLTPPLIITEDQIGEIVEKVAKVIRAIASSRPSCPGRGAAPFRRCAGEPGPISIHGKSAQWVPVLRSGVSRRTAPGTHGGHGTFKTPPRSLPAAMINVAAAEDRYMPALSSGLLRAGLALKLNQVNGPTNSYFRDRTSRPPAPPCPMPLRPGCLPPPAFFLIAALLVGAATLFRWIEINYGLFPALRPPATLLAVIAAICAGVAASRLTRPAPQFPSLASRLRARHQCQSDQAGPGRGGHQYRDGDPARARNAGERREPRTADVPPRPGRGRQKMQAGLW